MQFIANDVQPIVIIGQNTPELPSLHGTFTVGHRIIDMGTNRDVARGTFYDYLGGNRYRGMGVMVPVHCVAVYRLGGLMY